MTSDRDDLSGITFAQLIAERATVFPDRELVVSGPTRLTYAEFTSSMTDVARSLMALGIERGDRVAVWAPNSAEWLVSALGASSTGATLLPMNSRFKGAEAADVVARGRPSVVFTTRHFLDTDYAAMMRASTVGDLSARIVVLDGEASDGDLTFEDFLALGDRVEAAAAVERRESASPDDTSDLMLTSGTTGRPKAVMTSHRQNVLAFTRYARHFGLQTGERINATLPFFHNFGLKAGFLVPTLLGGTCVSETVFDPSRLAHLIESEQISFLKGTPALFAGLLSSPARKEADLGSLRLCFVAGAMIENSLVEQMKSELCPQVVTGYGLSELAGGISLTPTDASADRVSEWSGRLVEGVEVRVVDDLGQDVARGGAGEILARGECVMQGYHDDPAATAEAIDHDGWLHTGDIGILDTEDYLRITDRKKDMFIVGGFNTYPAEIERLLLTHPDIAQAAVVGMSDERLGEVGAAFLVARPGAHLHPEEVIGWARDTMANYKVPRRVEFVDAMPVNSSMKILKHELCARLTP